VCVVGVWQLDFWTCGVCAWCDSSHQAHTGEGNLEGGSFTGDPEGYAKEGSGNRHLSP